VPEPVLKESPPFASAELAIQAYRRGTPQLVWAYKNELGDEVGRIARWSRPGGGKMVRPVSLIDGAWRQKAMPSPRPLYRLAEVQSQWQQSVFVVEGEKAAEVLHKRGLVATTSAGGSSAASKSDWTPLAGQRIVILPDNDQAGRNYAEEVSRILSRLNAVVTLVELPGLPAGGDVADLFEPSAWSAARKVLDRAIDTQRKGRNS